MRVFFRSSAIYVISVAASLFAGAVLPSQSATDEVKIVSLTLVSKTSDGKPTDGDSIEPTVSPTGELVAYTSWAKNLSDKDLDAFSDVYIANVKTGEVQLVSLGLGGEAANGNSFAPVFSPDGRKLAFVSAATNLIENDTNGVSDLFLYDLKTKSIKRISVRRDRGQSDGSSGPASFSPDGKAVVFPTTATNLLSRRTDGSSYLVWKSLYGGSVLCVSCDAGGAIGNGYHATIAPDGKRVTFMSTSGSLVGMPTQTRANVYIKNMSTKKVVMASRGELKARTWFHHFQGAFAPNGKFAASWARVHAGAQSGWTHQGLYFFHLPTHKWTLLAEPNQDYFISYDPAKMKGLTFLPDGQGVVATDYTTRIFFVEYDGSIVKKVGEGVLSKTLSGEDVLTDSAVTSADGKHISYVTYDRALEEDQNYFRDVYIVQWARSQ